jgi:hypothetical protein
MFIYSQLQTPNYMKMYPLKLIKFLPLVDLYCIQMLIYLKFHQ